ncbi:MAG: tripartite tricarboxylate transporter substrate binding protein [Burkholderiales bacterium]|nr:tripartite tricarboxylate transporter substrate binding protein [Burkholderiales bacterium]
MNLLLRFFFRGLLVCLSASALAQPYPLKPVRLVVPWPPGGTNDIIARALAQRLGAALGHQVIVDNRGGSNGVIGASIVAQSQPDGYTLMSHSITSHVTNHAIYAHLPYDTISDFAPITQISSVALVIIVHPSFPPRTVAEFMKLAKRKPGTINYGSFGTGSMGHLAGELLKSMANINMTHVPYKGGGPQMIATIAGEVPVSFAGVSTAFPYIKAGRVRALAVTSSTRIAQLPDLPTVAETPGLKGYEAIVMYALWAPAKTPREIIAKLNSTVAQVIRTTGFRQVLSDNGMTEPVGNSPEDAAATIGTEMRKIAQLVGTAGVKRE